MIIFGVILMICGMAVGLWANSMQNSFEYNWYEMWGSSDYAYVDILLYVGIFVFVIGIILLIVGCTKRISNNDQKSYFNSGDLNVDIHNDEKRYPVLNDFTCVQCGALIDKSVSFCPNCGCENKYKSI